VLAQVWIVMNTQNKSTYIGKENIGKIGGFEIEFSGGRFQSHFGQSSPAVSLEY